MDPNIPVIDTATQHAIESTIPLIAPPTQHAIDSSIPFAAPGTQHAIDSSTLITVPATYLAQLKRKRRPNEEIEAEKAAKEAKRLAKEKARAEKDAEKRAKDAKKAERLRLAEQAKMEKQQRFIWSDRATAQLLDMVMILKKEHEATRESKASFIPWSRFFKEHSYRKTKYDSLKELSHDTLDRRYKALLTAYRTIRGSCTPTGDEELRSQLKRYHLSQATYDAICNHHLNTSAMQGVGGADAQEVADDQGTDAMDLTVNDLADTTVASTTEWPKSSDEDELEPSIAPKRMSTSLLRSNSTSAISSESSMPNRPGDSRGNPSGCACRLKDILDEVTKSREAFSNGLATLLLMQQQAQAQAEARADEREARAIQREEQVARLEEAREARHLEWEKKREAEREERRRQDEIRQQHEQEARAQERENGKMMQMMMMGILGKITGTADQSKPGSC